MSNKGVYRIAPATPGLLNITHEYVKILSSILKKEKEFATFFSFLIMDREAKLCQGQVIVAR